ncbi:PIN domain-containing protein [Pleurocapsa sp. FMAR1]|uniref:PIN domain-containing protein n=1 Tax=Pleurocapsa sp. FMAR1 TaxID=3040204 RepID=UPI0029C7BFBD|nr:PIN domain-containing protein [Pleurocapsa sp. FMAR1]
MNENVRNYLVNDYEWFINNLGLPDPNDRHVLAAAIKAKAKVIVTNNLKDFPQSELNKYNVEVQHTGYLYHMRSDILEDKSNRSLFRAGN